jgi:uncharacterized protein
MRTQQQAERLRIFINESDRWEGRSLHESIVRTAREQGLAGATALRGIEGFGAGGRVHSVKVLHLSEDVPIVIEILDQPEKIAAFLPTLDKMIGEGVVTVEKVNLLVYRRDESQSSESQADDDIPLEAPEYVPVDEPQLGFAISTDRTRSIIEAAKKSAAKSRRVFTDSADVLLAMLCESKGIAGMALNRLGIDCSAVERSLRDAVSRDEKSDGYLKTLESKSLAAAKWLDHRSAGTEDLLIALCQIRPSAATDILMRLGAQPRDICHEVLKMLGREDDWQGWLADHPDM